MLGVTACADPPPDEVTHQVIEGDGYRVYVHRNAELTEAASVPESIEGFESVEVYADSLVFSFSESPGDALKSGRVVAGSGGEGGYIRRIIETRDLGEGEFEVTTEHAHLTEFFADVAFYLEADPYADQWHSSDDDDGNYSPFGSQQQPMQRTQGGGQSGRGKNLSLLSGMNPLKCKQLPGFEVEFSKNWSAIPSYWFALDIAREGDDWLPGVSMVSGGGRLELTAENNLKFAGGAGFDCSWEFENAPTLWKLPVSFVVPPGVPVNITLVLEPTARAGLKGKAQVKGNFGSSYSDNLFFGASYFGAEFLKKYPGFATEEESNGWNGAVGHRPPTPASARPNEWSYHHGNDPVFTFDPRVVGQLSLTGYAEAGLMLGIYAYDTVGPTFTAGPAAELTVSADTDCKLKIDGKLGMDVKAGGVVKVPVIDLTVFELSGSVGAFAGHKLAHEDVAEACSAEDPFEMVCYEGLSDCTEYQNDRIDADGQCSCMGRLGIKPFVDGCQETAPMTQTPACVDDQFTCCALHTQSSIGECQCWSSDALAEYAETFETYEEACKYFIADLATNLESWLPVASCPVDQTPGGWEVQRSDDLGDAVRALSPRLQRWR